MKPKTFKEAWQLFDVPIDEDENIEEPYLHFPIGTNRFEVWHWLEDYYQCSIGDYLNNEI
jgi:hypothetical protein